MNRLSAVVALLIAFLVMGTAQASGLHNFYGEHPEVRTQEAFVQRFASGLKSVPRSGIVQLFNEQFGERLGTVDTLEALVTKLGSDEFEVRACQGPVDAFGFTDAGEFSTIHRKCYGDRARDELVLVHKATGLQVFSLFCANLLKPPLAACMELRIKRVGHAEEGPPQATIHILGQHISSDCGLQKVECYCVEIVSGRAMIAFHAAIVNKGDYDVVLVPRDMIAHIEILCVSVPGFVTPRGDPDRIFRGQGAEFARRNATGGQLTVLNLPTERLFYNWAGQRS